jgi:hypothetical protein
MLGSILGALTGFGGSVVPAVIDYFKEKQAAKERTEMMTMQVDLMKTGAEIDLKKFYAMANDDEHARLIQHDIAMQEDKGLMAGLRKSVRPVITYMFFGLFCAVEGTLIWHALQSGEQLVNVMNEVWDQETQAIFAAIISFWFGSRAIEKGRKK